MVTAYHNDVHGGASKNSFKAKCVDCHLPHESYVGYIFKKASNGISEVTYMLTHDAKDEPWQENRKNRAKFVYDSGCLSCHKTILDKNSSNANITDMHALYSKFKDDTKNKLDCVSCHKKRRPQRSWQNFTRDKTPASWQLVKRQNIEWEILMNN